MEYVLCRCATKGNKPTSPWRSFACAVRGCVSRGDDILFPSCWCRMNRFICPNEPVFEIGQTGLCDRIFRFILSELRWGESRHIMWRWQVSYGMRLYPQPVVIRHVKQSARNVPDVRRHCRHSAVLRISGCSSFCRAPHCQAFPLLMVRTGDSVPTIPWQVRLLPLDIKPVNLGASSQLAQGGRWLTSYPWPVAGRR